jgi:DNA topoisomerase III
MKLAGHNEFDGDTRRVYDFICRHFMGTLSRDLKYKSTTAKFKIDGEVFTSTSNVLIDAGFTKVCTWQAFGKNELSTLFQTGDKVKIKDVKLVESQTGPPSYLTESDLITLMEKHGIGTVSSSFIEISLNYIV